MISFPLIQKILPTIEGGSKEESVMTLIIILGIVVIIFVTSLISSRRRRRHRRSDANKKFSKRAFIKKGRSVGLSKAEAQTLTNIVMQQQLNSPFLIFSNDNYLDTVLKKSIFFIEQEIESEDLQEAQKHTIFRIKHILESSSMKKSLQTTTSKLRAEQPIVIRIQGVGRFQTKILSNKSNAIYVITPSTPEKKLIKIKNNTPVNVLFWKKNDQEFSFISKVIGHKEMNGQNCTLLQHTNKIVVSQQRKYKRKKIDKPVYFYPVSFITVGVGRKAKKQAVVEENNGTLGTLNDISVGGCSIITKRPLELASVIRIHFETETGTSVWCFGKVIRTTSNFNIDFTMHIKFAKLSKQTLNSINSIVYDYEN